MPFHMIGLAVTGGLILSKTNAKQKINNNRTNPLTPLIKSVNRMTEKITKTLKKEDYTGIVQQFLPQGAILIKPQFPPTNQSVFTADLDGDYQNELIAIYTYNNEIWILVCKKSNEKWEATTQLKNTDYKSINYLGFADVKGTGSKNLLIGWNTDDIYNKLDILKFENSQFDIMDSLEYSRLEVTDFSSRNKTASPAEIAVWTKNEENTYNINVLAWDGEKLSAVGNPTSYYARRVVPYFIQKVRSNSASEYDWYNLSEALLKAQAYRDVLLSIDIGMRINNDKTLAENFASIRKAALEKM